MPATPNPRPTLLRCRDVQRMLALSKSSIYAMIRDGKFPRPIRLGPRAVRWRADEIAEWTEGCERAGSERPR